jgi:acetyl esterase
MHLTKSLWPLQVSKHAAELGADASTLAVAGDSAGGNLAAAVALKARDEQPGHHPNLRFQLLVCPVCLA